jgi:hypothetical protein
MPEKEAQNMGTPAVPAPAGEHINSELEYQRQSAARLLELFASALRRAAQSGPIRDAARYVHEHYWKDLAAGIEHIVQERPGLSVLAAFMTGYIAGRLIRSR